MSGLLALLDDVAAIAKISAASLDDVVGHSAKVSAKAAGVVIDDAAVTPRYVVGFSPERELPMIARIARGSLRNKLLILLPAALALAVFAPWAITPILMLGGAYLCFEGAEKVHAAVAPHHAAHEDAAGPPLDAAALEEEKISGAVRTDFILSAEIMAIALAAIPAGVFWMKATILALVGTLITLGVYGFVALIVKADDVGLRMARHAPDSSSAAPVRALGRLLVRGMPRFLAVLSVVGTAAMIWVGGGIVLHGLETFGYGTLANLVHDLANAAAGAVPFGAAAVEWLVGAAGAGVFGLALGLALIPATNLVIAPLWRALAGRRSLAR